MRTAFLALPFVFIVNTAVRAQPYCTPTYSSAGAAGNFIDGFSLGSINTSGTGPTAPPGYEDYASFVPNVYTVVAPGSTYPVTITSGTFDPMPGQFDYYTIWIDLDHDFDFGPDELLATASTSGANETVALSLFVPADALDGYTVVRVVCVFDTPMPAACGSYTFGETEDYRLLIDDGSPCIPGYIFGANAGEHIAGFEYSTISNIGSGAPNGWAYNDYRYAGAGFIASVAPGSTHAVTITAGPYDPVLSEYENYSVWVDLDQSGTLTLDEKLASVNTTSANEVATFNLTIPADAASGYALLRVMCTNSVDPLDACGIYQIGETEDYTLVIDDGSPCLPVYALQTTNGYYLSEVSIDGASVLYSPGAPEWGYRSELYHGGAIAAGIPSNITITSGSNPDQNIGVWVDWGNDGFTAADLVFAQSMVPSFSDVAVSLTAPVNTAGHVRMRLGSSDAGSVDPCDVAVMPFGNGHFIDLTLAVSHTGWPCQNLMGYGTLFDDGIGSVVLDGLAYVDPSNDWPYSETSYSEVHRYDQGDPVSLTITSGDWSPEYYAIALDMDNDGQFDSPAEILASHTTSGPSETFDLQFPVPAACPPGQHFLRIMGYDPDFPPIDPCSNFYSGEVLDISILVEDPAGPCIPYQGSWTINGDFIDAVQLGTIQDPGDDTPWGAAYNDYTAQYTDLAVGTLDTLIITSGATGGNSYSAWIDYNNDNDFNDADESLLWIDIADPFTTGELTFTVPPGTTLGYRRLRVRCAPAGLFDACADAASGETEDHMVNITTNTGVWANAPLDFQVVRTGEGARLDGNPGLIGWTYTLLDALGRVLRTGLIASERTDLLMTPFAKGTYAVRCKGEGLEGVKRFVW